MKLLGKNEDIASVENVYKRRALLFISVIPLIGVFIGAVFYMLWNEIKQFCLNVIEEFKEFKEYFSKNTLITFKAAWHGELPDEPCDICINVQGNFTTDNYEMMLSDPPEGLTAGLYFNGRLVLRKYRNSHGGVRVERMGVNDEDK